jgi:diguanylate cyclase (GGDEF)-like protein
MPELYPNHAQRPHDFNHARCESFPIISGTSYYSNHSRIPLSRGASSHCSRPNGKKIRTMAKPGDGSSGDLIQAAELQQQAGEQRVLDLLDEIYELEQFREEQLILRKLGSYLKSSLTTLEAYSAIECFGPQLWPAATGAVYCFHATWDCLERVAAWGDASLNKQSLALQDCWALRRAQPHSIRDTGSDLLCGHIAQASGALPSFCVPLIGQRQMLGLLHLQRLKNIPNTSGKSMSTDPGLALAVAVAEDLGLALANVRLRELLREQSIRDALTGLFNRRFVEEFLVRELVRAERKTRQLSMIALDIDHFKRINDTFGHGAGDAVLRQVGTILQAHVRKSDIACRIGGEEFLLLLAESPLQLAAERAESIRKAIHQMTLTYEERDLGQITASFGAAAFPDHGRTAEALLRAVDEALYDAKHAGRNQVVSARHVEAVRP